MPLPLTDQPCAGSAHRSTQGSSAVTRDKAPSPFCVSPVTRSFDSQRSSAQSIRDGDSGLQCRADRLGLCLPAPSLPSHSQPSTHRQTALGLGFRICRTGGRRSTCKHSGVPSKQQKLIMPVVSTLPWHFYRQRSTMNKRIRVVLAYYKYS